MQARPFWLAVDGMRGPEDRAVVMAAILGCDPDAEVAVLPGRDVFAVRSAAPAEALRQAVQAAGFIAALRDHPPAEVSVAGVAGFIAVMLVQALLGAVVGLVAGLAAGFAMVALDPRCGTPGDSGGCAMGIPMVAIGGAVLGAPAGAALAIFRRWRRLSGAGHGG